MLYASSRGKARQAIQSGSRKENTWPMLLLLYPQKRNVALPPGQQRITDMLSVAKPRGASIAYVTVLESFLEAQDKTRVPYQVVETVLSNRLKNGSSART
jgi:hypothetical protein